MVIKKERQVAMVTFLTIIGYSFVPVLIFISLPLIDWISGKRILMQVRVVNIEDYVWTDTAFGDEHTLGVLVSVRPLPNDPTSYRAAPAVDPSFGHYCKEIHILDGSPIPDIGSVVTVTGWRSRCTGKMYLSGVIG